MRQHYTNMQTTSNLGLHCQAGMRQPSLYTYVEAFKKKITSPAVKLEARPCGMLKSCASRIIFTRPCFFSNKQFSCCKPQIQSISFPYHPPTNPLHVTLAPVLSPSLISPFKPAVLALPWFPRPFSCLCCAPSTRAASCSPCILFYMPIGCAGSAAWMLHQH